MLTSGAAAGLAFAVPSRRFRSELHSVPEGETLPLVEMVVRAAVGLGLGVATGVGHKGSADFSSFHVPYLMKSKLPKFLPAVYFER